MSRSELFVLNTKYLCRKRKIKLKDLEERIGVSQGYLNQTLNSGSVSLRFETVLKIIDELDVSVDEMLSEDFEKQERIRQLERELRILRGEEPSKIIGKVCEKRITEDGGLEIIVKKEKGA